MMNYELMTTQNAPVKMWTKGVCVGWSCFEVPILSRE